MAPRRSWCITAACYSCMTVQSVAGLISTSVPSVRLPIPQGRAALPDTWLQRNCMQPGRGAGQYSSAPSMLISIVGLTAPWVPHQVVATVTHSGSPALQLASDLARDKIKPVALMAARLLWAIVVAVVPSTRELEITLRLLMAAAVGMSIGLERRTSHCPAGMRTMALVAVGAALFTIISGYGFARADQSRVAASVASGVGFIGAGVITTTKKGTVIGEGVTDINADVRGLTTASAIWIASALGLACGAGLYYAAIFGTALTIYILRMSKVYNTVTSTWERVDDMLPKRLRRRIDTVKGHIDAQARPQPTGPIEIDPLARLQAEGAAARAYAASLAAYHQRAAYEKARTICLCVMQAKGGGQAATFEPTSGGLSPPGGDPPREPYHPALPREPPDSPSSP